MADAKITDLGDGGDPQDTDDFVVARGATNNKIAWSSMSNAIVSQQIAVGASNTTYTTGTVVLTGVGGGVTVSSNVGQAVEISVAAPVAQTVQTQNLHNLTLSGNTAGAMAQVSSGTLTLAGGNNITLSQAGNAITISAGAEMQTAISGVGNSETTYTSGTVLLSELANITIRSTTGQAFQFSVPSQSVQPETQTFVAGISASDTLYTSGNVRFTGSQAATVRSGTGQLVVIDVPAQSVQPETQTFIAGISASDTLYTSGNVRFTGVGGGITVSSNTGQRVDLSVAAPVAQSVQTQNMVAISATNTLYSSGTVLFTGSNMVTVKSSGAGQTIILDATQSVQTQSFLSAGMSTGGNTSGDTGYVTGRLNFAGGNNITLSGSTNAGSMTITISAPNLGAGAMSAGVSNLGNTAGSTGVTGTRLVLVGTNQVSLSQSTDANGGTVTINVPQQTAAAWENMPVLAAVRVTHLSGVSKTPFYWYENLPQGIQPANIAFRVSMVTASADLSLSAHFGIYTFVNSTSAALLGSGSNAFVVSSASSVSFSGQRELIMTSPGTVAAISSLTPGAYVFGMMFSATATGAMNASIYAASDAAGRALGGIRPGTNQLSTGTSQGVAGFYGYGSTTVNAMPANVQASEITNLGSGASSPLRPYIFIRS